MRAAYVREVLDNPVFCHRIYFAVFRGPVDYPESTAQGIAAAIRGGYTDQKIIVTIDGLRNSEEMSTAKKLRSLGIRLRDVRGARDESESLIRLADAACGWILASLEGQPAMQMLFERAIRTGILEDASGK